MSCERETLGTRRRRFRAGTRYIFPTRCHLEGCRSVSKRLFCPEHVLQVQRQAANADRGTADEDSRDCYSEPGTIFASKQRLPDASKFAPTCDVPNKNPRKSTPIQCWIAGDSKSRDSCHFSCTDQVLRVTCERSQCYEEGHLNRGDPLTAQPSVPSASHASPPSLHLPSSRISHRTAAADTKLQNALPVLSCRYYSARCAGARQHRQQSQSPTTTTPKWN
jgi:hypothetical protein